VSTEADLASQARPVETTAGRVRGLRLGNVLAFRGMHYGADTSGPNRFQAPQPVKPWPGVRDAFEYGPTAPQLSEFKPRSGFSALLRRPELPESEDCLVLNVWTPACDDARRAVMVWLHGGAFISGSGSGRVTSGGMLAHHEDVVVVSVNHRLNLLGYLDLGAVSDEFADSANAGMLDIIAALRWVRDNIAAFGGDPGRVTIFGESGGGLKVATLMAMPHAQGLFHRAVIESAAGIQARERERSAAGAERLLAALGRGPRDIGGIQQLPLKSLYAASTAIDPLSRFPAGVDGGWGATIDGRYLTRHPFEPDAPDVSAGVPLIIGSNRTEATLIMAPDADGFELDQAGFARRMGLLFDGGEGDRVAAAYRRAYPGASFSDLYFMIGTDQWLTVASAKIAERKSAKGVAPAWLYRFDWQTPVEGGKWRSPHTMDLPFVFQTARSPELEPMVGPEPDLGLVEQMSGAWAAFARTGEPNGAGLARWTPYSAASRDVMVFDHASGLVHDPDRELRELLEPIAFATSAGRGDVLLPARRELLSAGSLS
jgi:para-nitrobenzyl esterase